jgi:beta-N-acetylhexosaminidase
LSPVDAPRASGAPPRAVIFGCAGTVLGDAEKAFFAATDPLGFILFRRNVDNPEQVRALVAALRDCVGREAPVLIDQEGGRVQRLRPPHWHDAPPAATIGDLARQDAAAARRRAGDVGRAIANDLAPLGITVDCAPVCDVRFVSTHDAIGDRSFASDAETVAALALAFAAGLASGKVTPVIKHMPGHGRATVDSHLSLPVVTASEGELERVDFAAFRPLAKLPWGMTAHVLYTAIDGEQPGTLSRSVIDRAIRGAIGFDGLLLTDDLSMKALGGDVGPRAAAALAAGCDVVLHCNGDPAEMQAIAGAIGPLSEAAVARYESTARNLDLMLSNTSGARFSDNDISALTGAIKFIVN